MVEVCELCNKRIAIFRCNACKKNICNWCCDKFQNGQETIGWKRYCGKYSNFLMKHTKECSKCDYIFRNNEYKVDEKSDIGFGFMSYSFEYRDKRVFSFDFIELAKKKIRLVEKEVSKNIVDFYTLGDSYCISGQYEKGYENLYKANKLINRNTDNYDKVHIYIRIYNCCVVLNLYSEAESWMEKAMILDDTMSQLFRYKGDICRLQGDYEKSIMYYEYSLEKIGYDKNGDMDRFYENAYIGLSVSYSKLDRYDDTIKWANKFLDIIGDFQYIFGIYQKIKNGMTISGLGFSFDMVVDLYNLITISYLEKKEFATAKEYIEKSVKLAPENVKVAKLNGRVVQGLYMFDEICKLKKQLEEALSIRMSYTINFNGDVKADMINIGDNNTNNFNRSIMENKGTNKEIKPEQLIVNQIYNAIKLRENDPGRLYLTSETELSNDIRDIVKEKLQDFNIIFEREMPTGYAKVAIGESDFYIYTYEEGIYKILAIGENKEWGNFENQLKQLIGYMTKDVQFGFTIIFNKNVQTNTVLSKRIEILNNFCVEKDGQRHFEIVGSIVECEDMNDVLLTRHENPEKKGTYFSIYHFIINAKLIERETSALQARK
ncbi:hypothetical protein [Clostridium estertheticum]|uniref:Tetratricopeptide repeat protein n=1 Tax=Clostridium estertheticum TaxID=238834 RepID=A0A7Y3SZD4_9CLOT|nr:hypothetical protein [Clostridium estertheticum]NNU78171.1 hypothetical protein [Clostridium estertheticum]WBL47716.1 hypothetical protein LOR37_03235 [Clostridium estertheticum]